MTSAALPVVGVMGAGAVANAERAAPLGRWLAELGVHLLTGGGGGTMAAVSEAFANVRPRAGIVMAVVPGDDAGAPPPGYPNAWVELTVRTRLPDSGERGERLTSRNSINVLTSDVLVALPGGSGTASEVRLARRFGRPIVAWLERPDELDVPDGTPVAASLQEVAEFVRGELALWLE